MARSTSTSRTPELTRRKILDAAFAEFYAHGFQGGSLNHIVEIAGTTKGAVFHHFDGKQALGYAVLDDVIGPLLLDRWLVPIAETIDPVSAIKAAFGGTIETDIASGAYVNGCPLNNLAQEMSPLDEGFQTRIDNLYDTWRAAFAAALERGRAAGTVKSSVEPENAAAYLLAAQMGIWGSGKSSRNPMIMRQAADGLYAYLDSLRA